MNKFRVVRAYSVDYGTSSITTGQIYVIPAHLDVRKSITLRFSHLQAVLGAGPAGVCAARALLSRGHKPTLFEAASDYGLVVAYSK